MTMRMSCITSTVYRLPALSCTSISRSTMVFMGLPSGRGLWNLHRSPVGKPTPSRPPTKEAAHA